MVPPVINPCVIHRSASPVSDQSSSAGELAPAVVPLLLQQVLARLAVQRA